VSGVGIAQTVITVASCAGTLLAVWRWTHRIASRFEQLEEQAMRRKEDDAVILKTLLAVLDGLQQQGCNGKVTAAFETLNNHIIDNR